MGRSSSPLEAFTRAKRSAVTVASESRALSGDFMFLIMAKALSAATEDVGWSAYHRPSFERLGQAFTTVGSDLYPLIPFAASFLLMGFWNDPGPT